MTSTVGPWAQDKLGRLQKYLSAYTTIMRKQNWCAGYHYVDAFAGPGDHVVRTRRGRAAAATAPTLKGLEEFDSAPAEQQRFLAGSPRVALELENPFSSYVFVERAPERVAALEKLKAEYGNDRKITIRQGDCGAFLRSIATNGKTDWSKHRAVVLLDPFGMQVEWPTIELLAKTRAIDIFINFPVGMAIQRLLYRNSERFDERERAKLDSYFGTSDWYGHLYPSKPGLFGEQEQKVPDSGTALVEWYRGRLGTAFTHVSKAALIRNTKGGHLYYLLVASHNATGVRIANDILAAGERVRASRPKKSRG